MADVRVFVSYSWAVEEETGVVDELEALCLERNIELIRDKNAMQHGDLITNFMNNLAGGEHIITIFSKPYFKSKWCMYELLKIWKERDFQNCTHPLIVDDCNLGDEEYRLELKTYWKNYYEKIKALVDEHDPEDVVEEVKYVKSYREIYQNVNDIMNFAAVRLTTPIGSLKAEDYSQILDNIKPIEIKPRQASSDKNFHEVVMLDSGKARRIKQFEEQLEIWEDKLNEFIKELARAEGADARFSIKNKIKHDINPEIAKINKNYQSLLRDNEPIFSEVEAESIITQMETTIGENSGIDNPDIREQLELIRQEIKNQSKSATAKLKVALPVVPGIASYELDLDTENFLSEIWGKVRGLLKKKAEQVNP